MENTYFGHYRELLNGVCSNLGNTCTNTLASSLYLLFIGVCFLVAHKLLPKISKRIADNTKNIWDDILVEKQFLHYLSLIFPALLLKLGARHLFTAHSSIHFTIEILSELTLTVSIYLTIHAFLNALLNISERTQQLQDKPIKGYIQVLQITGVLIASIFCLAIIFQKPLIYFFSGIGATAALLLLVFKDSIMGFVTSIQLTANNMVKKGDWITMQKYNADGTVIDISLNTVKIQNWDKTISTIPTYAMISDSFQNWKGMEETGGRRIKRSLHIDLNSIKICSEKDLEILREIDLIQAYIDKKRTEIKESNASIIGNSPINGRHLTNIGVFRQYIESFLQHNDNIRKDLTFIIRQLQPGSTGLPIEIYVFSKETAWVKYEKIQADIFDHLIATAPYFGIKIFQQPSNSEYRDLLELAKSTQK